jgi:uncharacterized membrane protein
MSSETSSQKSENENPNADDVTDAPETKDVPESEEVVDSSLAEEAPANDEAADTPIAEETSESGDVVSDAPIDEEFPMEEEVPPPPVVQTVQRRDQDIDDNERLMAALAYFLWFIGSAIILLSPNMRARPYLRYHAVQALGLSTVLTVGSFVLLVMSFVFCCIGLLLLIPLVITLYYTYEAYQTKYFKIPVIHNIMASEDWLEQM